LNLSLYVRNLQNQQERNSSGKNQKVREYQKKRLRVKRLKRKKNFRGKMRGKSLAGDSNTLYSLSVKSGAV
jgi:hypothetical protein